MIKKLVFVVLVLCWNPAYLLAFTFDNWHSGMTLDEVLNLSEKKDIPIRRYGLVGTTEHFNPKTSRIYADKARTFYYKTRLVNEPAKVVLRFTEVSRLLYEVKVSWQGVNVKKDLPPAVEEMLQKKYESPTKSRKRFSKDKIWQLDRDNQLIMKNTGVVLQLRYIDLILEKTAIAEKERAQQMKRRQGVVKDQNKF